MKNPKWRYDRLGRFWGDLVSLGKTCFWNVCLVGWDSSGVSPFGVWRKRQRAVSSQVPGEEGAVARQAAFHIDYDLW